MGKVKDILRAETTATEYQFPMGKVKGQRNQRTCVHGYVSIPYGKGKAVFRDNKDGSKKVLFTYQFPMGKVKNNI